MKALFAALAVLLAAAALPASAEAPKDVLGLPGPYAVRGVEYRLAWSAQPSTAYAKHEYLPAGETSARYGSMVLVEVASGVSPAQAASAKAAELKARKASDPTANHAMLKNDATGEILLDFTLSGTAADGSPVSEWNAYRYAAAPGGGTLLFGLSRRAYGDDRLAFFKALKTERMADIRALAALPMPQPGR